VNLITDQVVKKFFEFYKTLNFITVFTRTRHWILASTAFWCCKKFCMHLSCYPCPLSSSFVFHDDNYTGRKTGVNYGDLHLNHFRHFSVRSVHPFTHTRTQSTFFPQDQR